MQHINPITRATAIIIERNEGKSQEDAQFLRAPSEDEVKTMALHLKVSCSDSVWELGWGAEALEFRGWIPVLAEGTRACAPGGESTQAQSSRQALVEWGSQ